MKKQPYLYVAYESIRRLSYIQSLGKISKNSITDEVLVEGIMGINGIIYGAAMSRVAKCTYRV